MVTTYKEKRTFEIKLIDYRSNKKTKTKSISLYGSDEPERILKEVKKVFQ